MLSLDKIYQLNILNFKFKNPNPFKVLTVTKTNIGVRHRQILKLNMDKNLMKKKRVKVKVKVKKDLFQGSRDHTEYEIRITTPCASQPSPLDKKENDTEVDGTYFWGLRVRKIFEKNNIKKEQDCIEIE